MENFFNDMKIADFLENYPCVHWVSILKSLIHYSIDTISINNCYPTLEQLFNILGENPQKANFITRIADLYAHLHKVDKSMKHLLKTSYCIDKQRIKSKNNTTLQIVLILT